MTKQLPIKTEDGGKRSTGYCTPKQDKVPQQVRVPPKNVLPIVFLPGIMGTNLRMKMPRQSTLKKSNNMAWRPDRKGEALDLIWVTPAYRQLALDPEATEVDTYDGGSSPTGTATETSNARHKVSKVDIDLSYAMNSPLLVDDPKTSNPRRSKEEKARERGWQEILLSSYQSILEECESKLNATDVDDAWSEVVDRSPSEWGAAESPPLSQLCINEVREALVPAWFPVHAMGYNWLESNADSATKIATRIEGLISQYVARGFCCEKVIVVTHSMGGLVARALVHPEIGGAADRVLGVVHGVMPSRGAPAAYRRMRCGFEEGLLGWAPAPKVLGNLGKEVTSVLANSKGGLQLLPSAAYGNGWLEIRKGRDVLKKLPANGNPYDEIYKLKNEWFGLFREEWINPAKRPDSNMARTFHYLDIARQFHEKIADHFHAQTFAHYGADAERKSWETISWKIGEGQLYRGWESLQIVKDNFQGTLVIRADNSEKLFDVTLGISTGPGDQTVPFRSSDHQRLCGRLKGVFLQSGYEHQASYMNKNAVLSTLYSLIRIIQTMNWGTHA